MLKSHEKSLGELNDIKSDSWADLLRNVGDRDALHIKIAE